MLCELRTFPLSSRGRRSAPKDLIQGCVLHDRLPINPESRVRSVPLRRVPRERMRNQLSRWRSEIGALAAQIGPRAGRLDRTNGFHTGGSERSLAVGEVLRRLRDSG